MTKLAWNLILVAFLSAQPVMAETVSESVSLGGNFEDPDGDGDPSTGPDLYRFDEIVFAEPVMLMFGDRLEIDIALIDIAGPYGLELENGVLTESLHVTVRGSVRSFTTVLRYFDEEWTERRFGSGTFSRPVSQAAGTVDRPSIDAEFPTDLFGQEKGEVLIRGLTLDIRNSDTGSKMTINSVSLGIDAKSIDYAIIPVPPSLVGMISGLFCIMGAARFRARSGTAASPGFVGAA
jgi:hypothetical protein